MLHFDIVCLPECNNADFLPYMQYYQRILLLIATVTRGNVPVHMSKTRKSRLDVYWKGGGVRQMFLMVDGNDLFSLAQ